MQLYAANEPREFLTAEQAPANLLRLQPGEVLRWKSSVRLVERVGYRKSIPDYLDEARAALRTPEGLRAVSLLYGLIYGSPLLMQEPRLSRLDWFLARKLAFANGFGGRERGLLVRTSPYSVDYSATPVRVVSTRVVRLGTYYGPSGSGEDAESGGLGKPRSVVLVLADIGEVISGDLVRFTH